VSRLGLQRPTGKQSVSYRAATRGGAVLQRALAASVYVGVVRGAPPFDVFSSL
jgi:hypothetical protein